MSAATADGLNDVYEALDSYHWDHDAEFQSGLSAILGSNSTPEQATELALRARCFYYSRKCSINIDFDAYKAYRNARNRPPPTPPTTNGTRSIFDGDVVGGSGTAGSIMPAPVNASEPPAPYPTSFAQIVALISSGEPVPGIKDIPDTVLEGQGTQARKARRKKPWEKDEAPTVGQEDNQQMAV